MSLNDGLPPHLFEGESGLMQQEMGRASSYLEFGMGGSTILAAQSGIRRIVSGDSDPTWLATVKEKAALAQPGVEIELVHCDLGRTGDWGAPVDRDLIANWPNYFVAPWRRFSTVTKRRI